MFFYNTPNPYSMDFYKHEIEQMQIKPEQELEEVKKPVEEPKKEVEEVHHPCDMKKQIKKQDKPKKEHQQINSLETLKNNFLNVKNKSLFIKRNKDKIKSLISEEQKEFIQIAKTYFQNM